MTKLPLILITVVTASILSMRELKNVQIMGYRGKPSPFRTAVHAVIGGLIVAVIVVGDKYFGDYSPAVYAGIVAISSIVGLLCYGSERTRFKFTRRGTRLFIALVAVYSGTATGIFLGGESELLGMCAGTVLISLCEPITRLTSFLLYPLEKLNNDRYVKRAKAELSAVPIIKIGITGSYGKTSCKNILAEMLKSRYVVIKTEGNYNTPMGIVKTVKDNVNVLGNAKNAVKPVVFIAEMGARHRGDITELADIVRPDYAIITGVGEQHTETFGSIEAVAKEKSELARYVRERGGTAVYNGDNDYTRKMVLRYGGITAGSGDSDYRIIGLKTGVFGLKFAIEDVYGEKTELSTELIGRHNALNIAMCYAMATKLGVPNEDIVTAVRDLRPVPHRLELKRIGNITVIDDGYNANYEGVLSAFDTLTCFEGRKVVYAQGIVELGRQAKRVNTDVGRALSRVADVVILSGVNADYIAVGLSEGGYRGEIKRFKSMKEVTDALPDILKSGDVVLFQNDIP